MNSHKQTASQALQYVEVDSDQEEQTSQTISTSQLAADLNRFQIQQDDLEEGVRQTKLQMLSPGKQVGVGYLEYVNTEEGRFSTLSDPQNASNLNFKSYSDHENQTIHSSRTQHIMNTDNSQVLDSSIEDYSESSSRSRSGASISIKSSLPALKLNIPLSVQTQAIFSVFSAVARQSSFQVIEMEQSIATAVSKTQFSFRKVLSRCFPVNKHGEAESETQICAIRLQLQVND